MSAEFQSSNRAQLAAGQPISELMSRALENPDLISLAAGFVDTFREFETGGGHYTWWSQRPGVRARNVGWRLDYVLASPGARPYLRGAAIHPEVMGSDHCPISVEVDAAVIDAGVDAGSGADSGAAQATTRSASGTENERTLRPPPGRRTARGTRA